MTGVPSAETMPTQVVLYQNYPNPFNPTTEVRFSVPPSGTRSRPPSADGGIGQPASGLAGDGGWVLLKVYDVLGREVAVLVNEKKSPGTYEVKWDAHDMPSGVYFCRLQVGQAVQVRKLLLAR